MYRWDPNYHYLYDSFLSIIEESPYEIKRLGQSLKRVQYGSSSLANREGEGFAMLRMLNLQDERWNLKNLKHVQFNEVEYKRYRVNKGDILFNRTNSKELVGKCAVFEADGDWVFASYFIRIQVDESKLIPEYVAFFINSQVGRMQIDAVSRQIAGMTNINAQELRAFKIPVPPIAKQLEIADLYKSAKRDRLNNEDEASRILGSIDNFLLTELGIVLPTENINTIENRTFKTSFKRIYGSRFDPFYNRDYFFQMKDSIATGKYRSVYLKQVMEGSLVKGYLPKLEEKDGNNKVIQINSISIDGTINLDNLITAKDVFKSNNKLLINDILIVITGATIGKIGFWDYPDEYMLGGDLVKFQTRSSEYDPFFVYAFLRTKPSQIEIKRNITGATNGHLSPEDIKHLLIPSPPLVVQQELAKSVRKKTEQAHQLLLKTKMEYEAMKKEIEKLILNP